MPGALPSLLALGPLAIAALLLALRRPSPPERTAERRAAARALALAVALQAAHFAEEAATDLHARLPGLFGLPFSLFAAFNLAWLAIWVASIPGLASARTGAFFAAWFLALGGILNGIAHPLLALAAGGYFPGLATAPLVAGASIWLWLPLRAATARGDGAA